MPNHKLPPTKTRLRLSPEQRMAEIISVTRSLLAEKGYQGVITSEVADRCGVSEGTIFKYFGSIRELLIRVAEEWFEEILGMVSSSIDSDDHIYDRLRQLIWQSLSIVRKEPSLTRFILMELRAAPNYREMKIYKLNQRFTSKINDVLQEAIDKGVFRDDVSVSLLRDMIFGCIEHQTWIYLRNEGDFSVDETTDGITNVIFRGMKMPETVDY